MQLSGWRPQPSSQSSDQGRGVGADVKQPLSFLLPEHTRRKRSMLGREKLIRVVGKQTPQTMK